METKELALRIYLDSFTGGSLNPKDGMFKAIERAFEFEEVFNEMERDRTMKAMAAISPDGSLNTPRKATGGESNGVDQSNEINAVYARLYKLWDARDKVYTNCILEADEMAQIKVYLDEVYSGIFANLKKMDELIKHYNL